jgi:hypothetical protein
MLETLNGEGHERLFSRITKVVGSTVRETKQNRDMDISLKVGSMAQQKRENFIDSVNHGINVAFAGRLLLEG